MNKYKFWKFPEAKIQLYWFIYIVVFFLLERVLEPRWFIQCPIDDLIPFNEYFIIFYGAWFFMLPFTFFYLVFTDRKTFLWTSIIMFAGMSISLLIYVLFPNYINLRPVITQDNICAQLMQLVYTMDTPTNVCPSIHCSSTMAMILGFWKSEQAPKSLKWSMTGLGIMICISTMVTKQHSILDVIAGILLTCILAYGHKKWNWFGKIEECFQG